MPPVFDKNCKLKVIEYGDHSKSIHINKTAVFQQISAFLRRLFGLARKA